MTGALPEILLRRNGRLGQIILNRPAAMNALTHGMVTRMSTVLDEWESDDGIDTVLLTGSGERGLCAGGDIVAIYRDAKNGGTESARFWADEYTLNARIARYPKPYVAVMDGLVLGGGVGVSAHASIRIVTERTRLGMPETGIGFVPDVGGTYLLSRAPGELGTHLALTAGMVSGADAIALGMADHFIGSDKVPALGEALAGAEAHETVRALATDPPPSALLAERDWIDECYAGDDVEEIVRALQRSPSEAARHAAGVILAKSPTALKVTLESLRRARGLPDLETVLAQEYRVSLRFLAGTDLVEGVRAQIIDKDRQPRWSPPTLDEVTAETVGGYFADLGPNELRLDRARDPASTRTTRPTTT